MEEPIYYKGFNHIGRFIDIFGLHPECKLLFEEKLNYKLKVHGKKQPNETIRCSFCIERELKAKKEADIANKERLEKEAAAAKEARIAVLKADIKVLEETV